MTPNDIKKAIEQAWANANKIYTKSGGGRDFYRGQWDGGTVEMYHNPLTQLIETAYPKP